MELKGEYRIAAPRERVWEALNDPEVLKASIPGCEELEKTSENGFAAKVTAKVGPVKAKFGGEVTLSNINPPESYTISGEGKGGAAGFAKGSADVALIDTGDGQTDLSYVVNANVGGKLAQLGTRLIQGTAKKMADDFFSRFRSQVEEAGAAEAATAGQEAEMEVAAKPEEAAQPSVPSEPVDTVSQPASETPEESDTAAATPATPEHTLAHAEAAPPATDTRETTETPAGSEARSKERQRERAKKADVSPVERLKSQGMSPIAWIAGLIVLLLVLVWLSM